MFQITPAGKFTILHEFGAQDASGANQDGALPQASLIQASDGSFIGTASSGGADGDGVIFRMTLLPGTLQLAPAIFNVAENGKTANLRVTRTNGNTGAVSVLYATADGSALKTVDYTPTSGTLSWADGDNTTKIISVPILDHGLYDGSSKTFSVVLGFPSGGATLGSIHSATVAILDNDVPPQPTIDFVSPPSDLTLVSGATVSLRVAINDPAGILAKVAFYLGNDQLGESQSTAPFDQNFAVPASGSYVLKAVLTDSRNRQSTSTRSITVVDASTADPAPNTKIISDLDGRKVAGAAMIPIVATAESLSPDGTPLAKVAFYADNTLIAAFDGAGNPLTSGQPTSTHHAAHRADRRRTAEDSGPEIRDTIYRTGFMVPDRDDPINIQFVGTTSQGRSTVSQPVTLHPVQTGPGRGRPPNARFGNVHGGQIFVAGLPFPVLVDVTDPDASANVPPRAQGKATGRSKVFGDPGSVVSLVEYYLNQVKVASSTKPPYSFDIAPPTAGTYVLQVIATDDSGLAGFADPVTIQVIAPAVVSLVLPGAGGGNKATIVEGNALKLRVTRAGGDMTQPLTVNYKPKGANVAGVDYKALSGSVTIPAEAASAKIKLRFLDDGATDGDKLLKLRLVPSTDNSYTLGTPAQVKIRVLDLQGAQ